MNPQNAIIGDAQTTDLPQSQLDENQLIDERKMARYSKTSEYKRIEQHFNERIAFYQSYLPDGRTLDGAANMTELGQNWMVANRIINELTNVLVSYELANEAVEDAS